jgi:hypothetical protein
MTEQDLLAQIDAESSDLEIHTQLCHLRYEQLTRKFEVVEKRFDKLEKLLTDLSSTVSSQKTTNQEMFSKWSNAIIVVLISIVGFLISNLPIFHQ